MNGSKPIWGGRASAILAICLGLLASGLLLQSQTSKTNLPPTGAPPGGDTPGGLERISNLIGREIRSPGNQRLARIQDFVVDLESGRILYAVASTRGFLGMGSRRLAIPSGALRQEGDLLRIDADKQKLSGAPQFTEKQAKHLEDSALVVSAFEYFNQPPWWEIGIGAVKPQFNNAHQVTRLIGMTVRDSANEALGEVDNLVVELAECRILCVVLAPDRVLGFKRSLFAVPPNSLTPSPNQDGLSTSIDRGKLASAPRFDRDHWPDMSRSSWTSRIYRHFGNQAYFDDGQLRATGRTNTNTNSKQRIYHEPGDVKQ